MSIQEAQQTVDEWIQTIGIRYFDPLTNTALLMEEVGEVARLMARLHGEQSFKTLEQVASAPTDLADEMADVLFVLLCLANQTGIDLTTALQKNLDKKTARDAARHAGNEKLKIDHCPLAIDCPMPISAYLQKKALFRPTRLAVDYAFQFEAPFQELWLEAADGVRLNALFFPTNPDKTPLESPNHPISKSPIILYFHGNRDNLQRWGAQQARFTSLGFDFFAPDYRGYGKSGGEPAEADLFADARLMYDWVRERYPPERIVLYGRSLGSGMASYLAAHVPARMLILETPFDSFPGLLASHLRREVLPFEAAFQFPNAEHLRATHLSVLIFHGTRDRVVPYACAARLKACLKPGDAFITLEGGSHGNLGDFPKYQEKLAEWLGRV